MKRVNYDRNSYPFEKRARLPSQNHNYSRPLSYGRRPNSSSHIQRRSPPTSYRNIQPRKKPTPLNKSIRQGRSIKKKIFMSVFFLMITTLGVYFYFNLTDIGNEVITISDKRVAAFYYGWYSNSTDYSQTTPILVVDDKSWRNWGNDPQNNLEATSRWTPNQGWFDSADPSVIETHLRQAEWAGIDAFIVSFWGTGNYKYENFKTMLRVASRIGSKLKFSLYLETKKYSELSNPEAINLLTSELESIYDYFTDENQNPEKEFIWIHEDKPVLFSYVSRFVKEDVWSTTLNYLANKGKSFFLNADRPGSSPALNNYFQGAHQYDVYYPLYSNTYDDTFLDLKTHCMQFNQVFCAGVGPGYDDTYVRPEANHPPLERFNGDTYRNCWEKARVLNPDWITITSWNEWHEGSEIEPSIENGDLALRQTKSFIQDFKAEDLQSKNPMKSLNFSNSLIILMINSVWITLIEIFITTIMF